MNKLVERNLKVFFRDRSAVFFSLLAVFIIIGLYALFLGDVWLNNFTELENARTIMNNWIISGLLTVTCLTTTMGAFGLMVEDKTRKIVKDFHSSPIKKSSIAGAYIISAFVIGVIMTVVALILGELYIVLDGGSLLSFTALLKVLGLILLSTFASTAMIFFIVSFFKSQNAFATASTIVGTLIGFLTGVYLPVGTLPEGVQYVIKVFPISHAGVLFRQIMLEAPIEEGFAQVPLSFKESFMEMMGVSYQFGDTTVTPMVSILFLCLTGVVFYALSILSISQKRS